MLYVLVTFSDPFAIIDKAKSLSCNENVQLQRPSMLCRICIDAAQRCKCCISIIKVLPSERLELLFLHWPFAVELEWIKGVLCEKRFHAADHHRQEHWQRVSTVHCWPQHRGSQWFRHRTEEYLCVAWCSRWTRWRLCSMALDQRSTFRLVFRHVYICIFNFIPFFHCASARKSMLSAAIIFEFHQSVLTNSQHVLYRFFSS